MCLDHSMRGCRFVGRGWAVWYCMGGAVGAPVRGGATVPFQLVAAAGAGKQGEMWTKVF